MGSCFSKGGPDYDNDTYLNTTLARAGSGSRPGAELTIIENVPMQNILRNPESAAAESTDEVKKNGEGKADDPKMKEVAPVAPPKTGNFLAKVFGNFSSGKPVSNVPTVVKNADEPAGTSTGGAGSGANAAAAADTEGVAVAPPPTAPLAENEFEDF